MSLDRCRLMEFPRVPDQRGNLTFIEGGKHLPFPIARAYYLYMQNLRRRGYRGPSLPTGVTNESLRRSIEGAQNSANAYIQSGMVNSNRRSNAVANWDYRALRGCQQVVNVYGHTTLVCPY